MPGYVDKLTLPVGPPDFIKEDPLLIPAPAFAGRILELEALQDEDELSPSMIRAQEEMAAAAQAEEARLEMGLYTAAGSAVDRLLRRTKPPRIFARDNTLSGTEYEVQTWEACEKVVVQERADYFEFVVRRWRRLLCCDGCCFLVLTVILCLVYARSCAISALLSPLLVC